MIIKVIYTFKNLTTSLDAQTIAVPSKPIMSDKPELEPESKLTSESED